MTDAADIDVVDVFCVGDIQVAMTRWEKDGVIEFLIAFAPEGDEIAEAPTYSEKRLHDLGDSIEAARAWIDFQHGHRGLASLHHRLRNHQITGHFLGDQDVI